METHPYLMLLNLALKVPPSLTSHINNEGDQRGAHIHRVIQGFVHSLVNHPAWCAHKLCRYCMPNYSHA